jgi:hypothetical protein
MFRSNTFSGSLTLGDHTSWGCKKSAQNPCVVKIPYAIVASSFVAGGPLGGRFSEAIGPFLNSFQAPSDGALRSYRIPSGA